MLCQIYYFQCQSSISPVLDERSCHESSASNCTLDSRIQNKGLKKFISKLIEDHSQIRKGFFPLEWGSSRGGADRDGLLFAEVVGTRIRVDTSMCTETI
jgi:hypothetical protein